jgi:catalase
MPDDAKARTVENIVGAMSGISRSLKDKIVNLQLCHWFRADIGLGMRIAQGLRIDAGAIMPKQHTV